MQTTNSNQYPAQFVIEIIRYTLLFISKICWRIEYHGVENIPQNLKSGLLVTPNHQTYFDPFWVCLPIKRKYRFMAWDQAFNWFLVGRMIRYLGAFPVSLKRGGTRRAMLQALTCLRDGATLIIFPEGSRGFSNGDLLEFKTGAIRIAQEADVPILPVTICGANEVWAQDIKFPKFRKVDIFFHPVFEIPPNCDGLDEQEFAKKLTEQLKIIIESKLDQS